MSRTKRFYNKKTPFTTNSEVYHPFAYRCMGNCPMCRGAYEEWIKQKHTRKHKALKFNSRLYP